MILSRSSKLLDRKQNQCILFLHNFLFAFFVSTDLYLHKSRWRQQPFLASSHDSPWNISSSSKQLIAIAMHTWVSSPIGSARRPCRRLLWTGRHLCSQLDHRQNPILALLPHNPTSWGKSLLPILAWSDRFEKLGITYKQQKHLPYSTHRHRWASRQGKHCPSSLFPQGCQAWDFPQGWPVLKHDI